MPCPSTWTRSPVIGWIDAGSPAEKADLRIEDEILTINKRKVATWSDVEIAIGTKPEKPSALEIRRDGAVVPMELTTGTEQGQPVRDRLCRVLREDPDPGPDGHPGLAGRRRPACRPAT